MENITTEPLPTFDTTNYAIIDTFDVKLSIARQTVLRDDTVMYVNSYMNLILKWVEEERNLVNPFKRFFIQLFNPNYFLLKAITAMNKDNALQCIPVNCH